MVVAPTDAHICTTTCTYTVTQPSAALTATCSGTDVDCFGNTTGSASVSVSGGTTPYTHLWSNGSTDASISSLAAGSYTVVGTISDNNYQGSATDVLTINP